ncbi:MAG: MFS transporter, partial [Longimicrobiales bacterium]
APLGSLLAGSIAARFGAPVVIGAGGAGCIIAAGVFGAHLPALREIVRPIYVRMGILPEVARGIQAATHNATPDTDDGAADVA